MRIDSITLKNFRQYCGTTTVDLTAAYGNELVIIYGENMSGKTGFFLAINWCLYGIATGRTEDDIPVFSQGSDASNYLLNTRALEEGDYTVSVRLEMQHDGHTWVLERSAHCAGDPLNGDPFREEPTLQIDGAFVPRAEIRERVSGMLHREASQFYFFDGEMLSQYERWLETPQDHEVRVRAAIERVVGVAALRLHSELATVAADAEAEQRRAVTRLRREEALVQEAEECATRIGELRDEISEYESQIETLQVENARISEQHGALTAFLEERGRLDQIRRDLDQADRDLEDAEAALRELIHTVYWLPLGQRAEQFRGELWGGLEGSLVAARAAAHAHLIKTSLDHDECDLCKRQLDAGTRQRLRAEQNSLALAAIGGGNVEDLLEQASHLQAADFYRVSGEMEHLRALEERRIDARTRRSDLEDQERRILQAHSDRPRGADRDEQMEKLQQNIASIADAQSRLKLARGDLQEAEEKQNRLQDRINRVVSDPSIQMTARISRLAVQMFTRAIGRFMEAARESVETHASAIFSELVEEEGYSGLKIDGQYRLTTVDSGDRPLPVPSAGGQQLVTLSLVGGLNATAVHSAPIVMDTPAGRIDMQNRRRILRWVAGLNRQVVLMVHSGEYTPSQVADLGVEIGRGYRINKLSPYESEIVPEDQAW